MFHKMLDVRHKQPEGTKILHPRAKLIGLTCKRRKSNDVALGTNTMQRTVGLALLQGAQKM